MNKTYQSVVIIFLLIALVGIGYIIFDKSDEPKESLSSVGVTNEYWATSTAYMSGLLVKTAAFNQLIASSTRGTVILGSVVVASTTASSMSIYNATSSNAMLDGTYSTLITRFPTSTPQKTYTFDIILDKGLLLEIQAGFAGDYVITYRRN